MNERLGFLSAHHESNGNPGTISTGQGDYGGKSYGCYQMSSKLKVVEEFLKFLNTHYPAIYRALSVHQMYSDKFDADWKSYAKLYPAMFEKAQWEYIKSEYYDVSASLIKSVLKVDLSKRSFALQNVIWSTAVQHGWSGCMTVLKHALNGKNMADVKDADLIVAIYTERGRNGGMAYFSKCNEITRKGVCDRYVKECKEALGIK